MTFVKYLDNRFQELAVYAANPNSPYSTFKDAEQNAINTVLSIYRFIFRILFIPKVLLCFFLVIVKLKKAPLPQMEMLKAQHDAQEAAQLASRNKKAKKVGFQPKSNQPPLPGFSQ